MALQIRRRIGGAAGAPSTLEAGQLAYNDDGDELWIGDGTNVNTLISADRQGEIEGAQTINGAKTIDIANLHIEGGADGDVLSTDGTGVLDWVAQPPASVEVDDPIDGNGLTATPLSVTPATTAQVTAGTDNVFPITSLRLREKLGAEVSTLTTTAQTIVPAINEIDAVVRALEGPVRLVGTYDATTHQVTPGSPFVTAGPLPAAATANAGWVFVVDTAGTGVAPAPTVAMSPGDWLLSSGTAWLHIDLHAPATVASNVSITSIAGLTATDVQAALAELHGRTVQVDGVTIAGDGTTGDPLEVIGYDDGTY